ncbi:MAG: hypothetical protein ABIZ52_02790 [Candidatus Limnocylindrales bacterium]
MPAIDRKIVPTRLAVTAAAFLAIVLAACGQGAAATSAPSAAAATMATGIMSRANFHDVDGTATGEAQLFETPTGGYEVILENFSIASIAHTNVVLVANLDVTATGDVDKLKLLDLGPLKSTTGMQDLPIPAQMAASVMDGYHTVLIWDTEMAHAIAAAPLK